MVSKLFSIIASSILWLLSWMVSQLFLLRHVWYLGWYHNYFLFLVPLFYFLFLVTLSYSWYHGWYLETIENYLELSSWEFILSSDPEILKEKVLLCLRDRKTVFLILNFIILARWWPPPVVSILFKFQLLPIFSSQWYLSHGGSISWFLFNLFSTISYYWC